MASTQWPALSFPDWENTCDTVHLWSQIVGMTQMKLTPRVNHWWHVTLQVTPVGFTTPAIPHGGRTFEIEFDLISHRLRIRTSDGRERIVPLYARSVADFQVEYLSSLRSLGIEVRIPAVPVEFDDLTPFAEDQHHASYDRPQVESFRQILVNADRVLKLFRARFLGKCSPVHFFWGSFDLAVTRFSGRRAPQREGVDAMTREAYSHEVISCGFWPGDRKFKDAAFYSYTAPSPPGLEALTPYWNNQLGEFILKYDDVRAADSPDKTILGFCQSTYEAGAKLAGWDRTALERYLG